MIEHGDNPFEGLGDPRYLFRHDPPAPRFPVVLALPDGVRGRIEGTVPPEALYGTSRRALPEGEWKLQVDLPDGRRYRCPFSIAPDDPERARRVALDGSGGGDEAMSLDGASCERVRGPDPVWRPDLHLAWYDAPYEERVFTRRTGYTPESSKLVVRHDASGVPDRFYSVPRAPVVAASEVLAVKHRHPFYRVELSEAGAKALCEATRAPDAAEGFRPEHPVVLLVDGVVVGAAPHDTREQCTGTVSVFAAGAPGAPGSAPPSGAPSAPQRSSPWPMSSEESPLLAEIPPEEDDIAALGRLMQERVYDEFERTKLVHDFIVDRLDYDHASAGTPHRAPQDADTVIRDRKGVCAGYANLAVALGRAAGLEVVYLVGLARVGTAGEPQPHAWNAVRIDGDWYLFDVTWDDGVFVDGTPHYGSGYLFPPPEVFAASHHPTDPGWQLLPVPIPEETFLALPPLRPAFHAAGLSLLTPRPTLGPDGAVTLRIDNPRGVFVAAEIGPPDGDRVRCGVRGYHLLTITCEGAAVGDEVLLWSHKIFERSEYGGKIPIGP